MVNIFGRGFT